MMTAVIIDDEQHCIDRLLYLVKNYCADKLEIIGQAYDVISGLELVNAAKPELVFLDVQIGEQTGFDLLANFVEVPFNVVFTTAHEKYAIQAFKHSAVDYLLKPIDPDELKNTVRKLAQKSGLHTQHEQWKTLLYEFRPPELRAPKITIPTINGFEFIKVNDIVRCRSDVNYTTIYFKDKTQLMVAKTLKEFEEMLLVYNFCRIHNSHLVNLAFIKSYNKGKGGYVQMEDKTELEVSVRRKDAFLKMLQLLK